MKQLARIAVERGCGRFEWSCSTGTSRRSGLQESRREADGRLSIVRVTGDALQKLAST